MLPVVKLQAALRPYAMYIESVCDYCAKFSVSPFSKLLHSVLHMQDCPLSPSFFYFYICLSLSFLVSVCPAVSQYICEPVLSFFFLLFTSTRPFRFLCHRSFALFFRMQNVISRLHFVTAYNIMKFCKGCLGQRESILMKTLLIHREVFFFLRSSQL